MEITLPGGAKYRPRFPDSPFLHLPDFVDPETDKTYRELNMEKRHAIPIGTLVEIVSHSDDDAYDGVRLYVVHHHRDCDGTPLYAMAWDKRDTVQERSGFHNPKWLHGFSQDSLRVVS